MITLITGQPGAGKTLFTLYKVKEQAEKEGRTVYYNGIQLKRDIGWNETDKPEEWYNLPTGSIIVLDECQRMFRPRGTGSTVPEYVSRLETHRHQGLDLFLITQHPMLVDTNVRRLIGRHFHVQRSFGMQRATVHEFQDLRTEPDKNRNGSIKHQFAYPKEIFEIYQSAEVHTVKRRIPLRIFGLLAIPFILVALIYIAIAWLQSKGEKKESGEGGPLVGTAVPGSSSPSSAQPHLSIAQYVDLRNPRIYGLPHTAPAYDKLTEPTTSPKPKACVQSASNGCKCYTDQATPIEMDAEMCRQIVANGYFDDSDETREKSYLAKNDSSLKSVSENNN